MRIMTRILVSMMLWYQDEVCRSCIGIMWLRLCEWLCVEIMWLVSLVTRTLQLPSLLDTSSVECRSHLLRNGNLVKNLPTQLWETEEENRVINENILASWGSWWVSEGHVASGKPPNPMTGDWGKKLDKRSIDEKPPTDKGDREENRKIIKCRYHQWKNLPIWTKDREWKTEIGGEREDVVWSMRDLDDKDLDDKGLGQNSDSFLSPLPCCFFLVASLGALLSASCRSLLLSFGEKLDYWSSHWWCGVDSKKCRYWLVRVVLVEQADELSKILDR